LPLEEVAFDRSELSAIVFDALLRRKGLKPEGPEIEPAKLHIFPHFHEVLTLAEFVVTAAASGIIGNLAYDAMKRWFGALRQVRPDADVLEQIALFAVAEQCRRFQLGVDPSKLRVRQWRHSPAYTVADIDAKESELRAEVTIPLEVGEFRRSGVNVRIRDVSQRMEIGRAATEVYDSAYPHADYLLEKRRKKKRHPPSDEGDPNGLYAEALDQWKDAVWAQILWDDDQKERPLEPGRLPMFWSGRPPPEDS
jgi:hypothetical protein